MGRAERVLVTGASSFVGRRLVERLLERGDHVRVLVHASPPSGLEGRVDIVHGSVSDPAVVREITADRQVVFHLASSSSQPAAPAPVHHRINVVGALNVLAAAEAAGVRRLVHCGTAGVLGSVDPGRPADERAPCRPGNHYERTRAEAERHLLEAAPELRVDATVARPCSVYGPGDRRLLKLFQLVERGRLFLLGRRPTFHHLVHVDDLVRGLLGLAEAPSAAVRGEVFHLAGGECPTLDELAQLVAEATGGRPARLHLPALPFRFAAVACEALSRPLGISPLLYRGRIQFFLVHRRYDISKARRVLGWTPSIPLAQGLAGTAAWYREKGWLRSQRD